LRWLHIKQWVNIAGATDYAIATATTTVNASSNSVLWLYKFAQYNVNHLA